MLHRLASLAPRVLTYLGATVRDVQRDPAVAGGLIARLASGGVLYCTYSIPGAAGVQKGPRKYGVRVRYSVCLVSALTPKLVANSTL